MAQTIDNATIHAPTEPCEHLKDSAGDRVFGKDLTNKNIIKHRKNKRPISAVEDDHTSPKPLKRRRMETGYVCSSTGNIEEVSALDGKHSLKYIAPCDQEDEVNCCACVEYIEDIFKSLREKETAIPQYMEKQTDISRKMRGILLDWIVEVHNKFKLSVRSFHLAVRLLDRFLSLRDVKRTDLQLVGCTCLWVASKYHEIFAPEISDFTFVADQAFNQAQLLTMELQLLETLKFDISPVCPVVFVQRFIKIFTNTMKSRHKRVTMCLAMLFLEEALLNYSTALTKPSLLAAAVVAISFYSTVEKFHWNEQFMQYTGYELDDLMPVIRKLDEGHKKMCQKGSKFMRGLKRKFSGRKFERVAQLDLKHIPVCGIV